nr:ATP-dependent sacrificial sulfur transferase LarE [Desulfobacterales bacterium]
MGENSLSVKMKNLRRRLRGLGSLLVAFSGGVDSTFLLAVSHEILGKGVVAATAVSNIHPIREQEEAIKFTRKNGIQHILFQSDETGLPEFISNGPDRCYFCKKALLTKLFDIADERGIEYVAHAANLDDLKDYRPGARAAQETGVIEPLVDVGLTKDEIRSLSRKMGLPTWDKASMACLASRIPYGEPITDKKLKMVEEAEDFLLSKGFRQFRVRYHGSVARIEVESSELKMIVREETRKAVIENIKG